MKRKRNGGKPVFCESKNVPKIQTVEVDLYKKKDLKKFLESKEFKESKIDEELIVEYISSMKESSPAKKMLLLNSKLFEKYIVPPKVNLDKFEKLIRWSRSLELSLSFPVFLSFDTCIIKFLLSFCKPLIHLTFENFIRCKIENCSVKAF